jgi:phage shock protein PspC (stress-responsive transcriptional regulator)
MYRSFTDRVLGGVCGGLGALLPLNPWWFRTIFLILTIITAGAFALLYVALWMLLPQETLAGRQHGGSGLFLLAVLLTIATLVGWVLWLTGGLRGPGGEPLYWLGLLALVSIIFFLRQLRG